MFRLKAKENNEPTDFTDFTSPHIKIEYNFWSRQELRNECLHWKQKKTMILLILPILQAHILQLKIFLILAGAKNQVFRLKQKKTWP